jgi:sporulation integral membrane protein YlbJ
MKEKIFNTFIILLSLFVLIEILIKKSLIYTSIMYALRLWVGSLIPSLFPFFIISDILINYNSIDYIPKIIRNICKYLFGISDNMLTILFLSMISGFPSNARNTRMMYDKGLISLEDANHILMFSHFANPIFILTTVGVFFFKDQKLGIILLITHYISNIVLGILLRSKRNDGNYYITIKKVRFGDVIISAIRRSIDTILMICGILVVFLVISVIIVDTFHLNVYNSMIVKGICEVTIGLEALSKLNISNVYKVVIASMFLAFGGLSVHVQVLSQTADTDISYRSFLTGRIYQMIISGIITYIISRLLGI